MTALSLSQPLQHSARLGRALWRRLWPNGLLGVLIGLLIAGAALPVVLLDIGRSRARDCLAELEGIRAHLPDCEQQRSWFAIPARAPWTARWATLYDEELRARMAVARYVDAAVGSPNPALLQERWSGVVQASEAVAEGSGRLRLSQLGPTMPAPDPGELAFQVGDRLALEQHGFDWTQWYTSIHAMQAALLHGDVSRAKRLAEHYAGRPDSDLRLSVGALLCAGTDPARGLEQVWSVEESRAGHRNANIARDFGSARVLVEACAARQGIEPPPAPEYGGAGEWDHRERLAVMRLRFAQHQAGCEGPEAPAACHQALTEAANEIVRRLEGGMPQRHRLQLLAAVAEYFPDADFAHDLLGPVPDETLSFESVPLTLHRWVETAEADTPFVTPEQYQRSAEHLLALEPVSEPQRLAAAAMLVEAAREQAALGEIELARALSHRAGQLGLEDELARALLESSASYLAGDAAGAMQLLRQGLESNRAPSLVRTAATIQLGELLAASGQRDQARDLAQQAERAAADLPYLTERARWLGLALESLAGVPVPPSPTAPPPMLELGSANGWSSAAERSRRVDEVFGIWRIWLGSTGPARRASRYRAFRARGDAPQAWIPYLVVAGGLVDDPAQTETWLDAFGAIDSSRLSLREQAWSRAEAARWRGDERAANRWLKRFRALHRWAQQPATAELFQELRL